MKKLVYIAIILVLVMSCSHKEQPRQEEYVAPDSVWDYSELPNYDSINQAMRAYAYECYGDSDTTDLPDSVMRAKDSIDSIIQNEVCQ